MPYEEGLTGEDRREEILRYIIDFHELHGFAPSVREIGRGVGLTSTSTVHAHLKVMERQGIIEREFDTSRALVVKRSIGE